MSPFGSATLTLQGPSGKLRYEITGERTTVGRTRDNEIVLQDPAVSSHHCEFAADKTGLVVRDLNSSNGTYVNGRRVQAGPVYDGDALKIGQFQGRIAVRRLDGKPLRPPGVGGPAVIVAAVVGLLVVVAAGGAFFLYSRKNADRQVFTAYEEKAQAFLAVEPCRPVEESVRKLRVYTPKEQPELGRRGKLSKAEKEKNTELLEQSRKREPLLDAAVAAVQDAATKQQATLAELRSAAAKFKDAELATGARSLEAIYAERTTASEEFADALKRHRTQVIEFNDLLDRLVKRGDREAADQLDGYRYKAEPAKLLEECRAKFGKTQQDGLLRLAGLTP